MDQHPTYTKGTAMSYAEIVERRLALDTELDHQEVRATTADYPEWQQVSVRDRADDAGDGIIRQRCGGGYRIIRKKIGGN
jgi:hypothetical protein